MKNYIPLSGDITYEIRLEELNTIKQAFRPTN